MHGRKLWITVGVGVLVVGAITVTIFLWPQLTADTAAVPWQHMDMYFQDEDGVATIRCDAFGLSFAGHSFGMNKSSGRYIVDGRYAARLFGGPESTSLKGEDEVDYEYSQRKRLVTLRYQGHEITYSHSLKKLTVDSREYSTADGQVNLLIKANGDVERIAN